MHRQRLGRFEQLLGSNTSNDHSTSALHEQGEFFGSREELKELCLGGIPDSPSYLRPAAYSALLNLPSPAATLLDQYTAFVDELSRRVADAPPPSAGERLSSTDKLLREIERDVGRTFGGLAWFGGAPGEGVEPKEGEEDALWQRLGLLDALDEDKARSLAESSSSGASPSDPTPSPSLAPPVESGDSTSAPSVPVTPTSSSLADPSSPSARPQTRRQALLRPLFIYAMLNPGLSYVQGMNSLVAVFLFIFSSSSTSTSALEGEARAFFALGAILSQLRDLYVPSLDGASSPRRSVNGSPTPTGLGATLMRFTSLLTWLDPNVAAALEHKEIDPALYCFRWLTTLFANEFALPDLCRVWDRVISLFPSETDVDGAEALSPVLGHLIDVSLAMVLLERPVIVSPYSTFPKIVARLQDPQIDGEQVDKLLGIAWEIRERRLGKGKRSSVTQDGTTAANWRSAANKWAAAASAAASTASSSPAASSLRSRFWSTPSSPSNSMRSPAAASEFDLDDTASVAESEGSVASGAGGMLFASKGQRVGHIAEEVTTIDGKVLPPPPARIDEQVTLAQLIEAEMPKEVDGGDYSVDGEEEEGGPTLKERAAHSWGGWKTSLSRLAGSDAAAALSKTATNLQIQAQMRAAELAQSTARLSDADAAAALSKRTTNLSIHAQMLREQLAEQAPERLAKLRETVQGAGGRFMASGGAERGPSARRDGSPSEEPFTPPRFGERTPTSPRLAAAVAAFATLEGAASSGMEKSWSGGGGPRPLLLSGAARRASNASNPESSVSPPGSRRSSGAWRSPSVSPTFIRPTLPPLNDLPVPIGSLNRSASRGSHGRSASHFNPSTTSATASSISTHARSAFTAPSSSHTTSYAPISDDVPIHSLRLQSAEAESPTANRLRRPIPQHSQSSTSSVPSASGRGWTLSDAPMRAASPGASLKIGGEGEGGGTAFHTAASSLAGTPSVEHAEHEHNEVVQEEASDEEAPTDTNGVDDALRNMFAAADAHETVTDDVRNMFAAFPDDHSRPPRGSSLSSSTASVEPTPASPPPRQSSLGSSTSSLLPPIVADLHSPTVDEDSPLSPIVEPHSGSGTSLSNAPSRSKIVRRPGALKKRTSGGRGSIGGSIDLSAGDRRSVSEYLLSGGLSRSGSSSEEASVGRRGSARSKRSSVGNGVLGGTAAQRQSVVGWDEEELLSAYGEEADGEEQRS